MRVEKFKLEIATDGDAFNEFGRESKLGEIADCLNYVACQLRASLGHGYSDWQGDDSASGLIIRDANGNTCGRARLIIGRD